MKNYVILIWIASAFLFAVPVWSQRADEGYFQLFKLPSLEHEVAAKPSSLGVRFYDEDSGQFSCYTVTFSKDDAKIHGQFTAVTRSRDQNGPDFSHQRDLTDAEVDKILDLINRREFLFLPEEFTSVVKKVDKKEGRGLTVEIVSTSPPKRNVITRSLLESDSIQELEDWIKALDYAPHSKWRTLDRDGKIIAR